MSKRSSAVWDFFEQLEDGKKARCQLCCGIYSRAGGTSNLFDHLKRAHKEYLEAAKTNGVQQQAGAVSVYGHNSEEAKKLHLALAKCVATDLQPFCIVEDKGFREFVKLLNPRYALPCRRTLSNVLIPTLHEEVRGKLTAALAGAKNIALTTDGWTSNRLESYVTVTAHFVCDGKLISGCLDTSVLPGNHTAENIAHRLSEVMNTWGITGKVPAITTDNAAVMVSAVNKLNIRHVPCVAHTLNLLISDAIKATPSVADLLDRCGDIVTFFKHSNVASDKLRELQVAAQVSQLRPIQQVPTRWNSKLAMVRRLVDIKDQLILVQSQIVQMPRSLSAEEWLILKDLIRILTPFELMTKTLSGELYITSSQIIPLVHGLYLSLSSEKERCLSELGKSFHLVMLDLLPTRLFQYETRSVTRAATLLDPRFKKMAFRVPERAEDARRQVEVEVRNVLQQHDPHGDGEGAYASSTPQDGAGCSHWEGHSLLGFMAEKVAQYRSTSTATSNAAIIMRQYVERPPVPSLVDPITYWLSENNENGLSDVASWYLCVPATSVPAERMFSNAGQIITDRRNALSPEKAKQLIFLKGNLHFLPK